MYNELHAAWYWEVNEASLGHLSPDFYEKIANYLGRINTEHSLDKKSVKISLLEHEAKNVKRMLNELLEARYRKIIKTISKNQRVPSDLLTVEETKMSETFANFAEAYEYFSKNLLQGQAQLPTVKSVIEQSVPISVRIVEAKNQPQASSPPKRITLRFVKSIPAIMGTDMKSYGPFVAEDVASLPAVNAKMLIKQGLAVLVEVS